jgi:hypothetical protein
VKNSDGDDVRDVLAREGGEAAVREAIANAVDANCVEAPEKQECGASIKREIDASVKDLSDITPQAWAALQEYNDPPTLFRYAGVPSRIEDGDEYGPIIKSLDFHRMRYHLARAAWWKESRKIGEDRVTKTIPPPQEVVNDVLATPNQPLPLLSRIVEAPVFAPDGTLQIFPGYHPRSQTYFFSAQGLTVPDVPDQPNRADLDAARALIVDELLCDFPFVSEAELAHAVVTILLPFARDLIPGPTPLMLIEKPTPGTGATLLVDMLALPATGRPIPTMTEGRDEDEWRKRITAKLRSGPAIILIDNLRRRLDSAAVSAGITSTVWEHPRWLDFKSDVLGLRRATTRP